MSEADMKTDSRLAELDENVQAAVYAFLDMHKATFTDFSVELPGKLRWNRDGVGSAVLECVEGTLQFGYQIGSVTYLRECAAGDLKRSWDIEEALGSFHIGQMIWDETVVGRYDLGRYSVTEFRFNMSEGDVSGTITVEDRELNKSFEIYRYRSDRGVEVRVCGE